MRSEAKIGVMCDVSTSQSMPRMAGRHQKPQEEHEWFLS